MPTIDVNELIRTFSDDSTDSSSGSNWVHISRLNRSEYSPEIDIFDDDETVGTPTAIVKPINFLDFVDSDSNESSIIPPTAFPPKSAFLDLELIDIENMKLILAKIKPHIFVSDQPFVATYKLIVDRLLVFVVLRCFNFVLVFGWMVICYQEINTLTSLFA
jgi:hypothetical protein